MKKIKNSLTPVVEHLKKSNNIPFERVGGGFTICSVAFCANC